MRRIATHVWNFIYQNSLLLVIGAALALLWANTAPAAYHVIHDAVLIDHFFIGHAHASGTGEVTRTLTLHYLVNDILMALFFALAGKEVWEAIALQKTDRHGNMRDKGGSLRGKAAFTPLFATLGGMTGPVVIYLGIALFFGSSTFNAVFNGWAIPTATDIAFSYFVGRLVFGEKHPAVSFLLLLAIVDDAGGLLILAAFYPTGELHLAWLLLSGGAALFAFFTCNYLPRYLDARDGGGRFLHIRRTLSVWPYVIAGLISWYAFQESGLHPALGLLPVIPAIPHADQDHGFFASSEAKLHDLLNVIEHTLKVPVQLILFCFAFMNAGIQFTALGEATWLVFAGLLLGKPLGIFLFGFTAAFLFKWGLPDGMRTRDLFVLGFVAAIGFTVALFVASVAFPIGAVQDAAKMGALLSLLAVIPAVIIGAMLRVEKVTEHSARMQKHAYAE